MRLHPACAVRRARRLVALSLAVAALASCAPAARERLDYESLVIAGAVSRNGAAVRGAPAFCADETRFGIEAAAGDVLTASVTLGATPMLHVGGCGWPVDAKGRRLAVELAVRSPRRGSPVLRRALVPRRGTGWDEQAIDLARFAGKPVRVTMRLPAEARGKFVLRDLFVRQETATVDRPSPPRQVLLISIDTLREDALGAFGGATPTPHLDALAHEGQTWSPHYATSHWTKPSHASLLSGYPPEVHGMVDENAVLAPGLRTLAERFHDAGFRTGGLAANPWIGPRFGFGHGFDEYRDEEWTLPQAARYAVDWMARHRDEPFFYFLHTYEAHSDFSLLPYEAPGLRQRAVEQRFGVPRYGCRDGACAATLVEELDRGAIAPLPHEREILRFLYDRGVAGVDADLGRLFADLRELGLWDDLLVVVTADHGEQFQEHGGFSHSAPWQEVVRVPLIVKWPGGKYAGERRSTPSSALDVAPTLAAACGLDGSDLPGTDLLHRRADQPIFIAAEGYRVVLRGRFKGYAEDNGPPRLYDLANDPLERSNLAPLQPRLVADLGGVLHEHERRSERTRIAAAERAPAALPASLTPEEAARLRSLGY